MCPGGVESCMYAISGFVCYSCSPAAARGRQGGGRAAGPLTQHCPVRSTPPAMPPLRAPATASAPLCTRALFLGSGLFSRVAFRGDTPPLLLVAAGDDGNAISAAAGVHQTRPLACGTCQPMHANLCTNRNLLSGANPCFWASVARHPPVACQPPAPLTSPCTAQLALRTQPLSTRLLSVLEPSLPTPAGRGAAALVLPLPRPTQPLSHRRLRWFARVRPAACGPAATSTFPSFLRGCVLCAVCGCDPPVICRPNTLLV